MSLIYPSVKVPFTYLMFIYKMYYNIQSIDLPEVVTLSFTGKRPDHRKSLTMDRKHVTETDDPLVPVHCVLAAFANPNGLPDPPVVKILLSFSSNVYDPLLTISGHFLVEFPVVWMIWYDMIWNDIYIAPFDQKDTKRFRGKKERKGRRKRGQKLHLLREK